MISLLLTTLYKLCLQGAVQCCVTGPAFACLLQQPNQALVQSVILNSVAFTRMKSEQKGQLMELLGSKGLHHIVTGQRQHIQVFFCFLSFLFCSRSSASCFRLIANGQRQHAKVFFITCSSSIFCSVSVARGRPARWDTSCSSESHIVDG